jgi:Pyruvate/2-oxoacid:ferredoxin oxidoreductase gamma subunit
MVWLPGGSVTAHLKLGDHYFPLIMKGMAHVALALAPTEELRAREYLALGGLLVTNRKGRGEERGVFPVQAGELASEELGSPLCANFVMLGALGCKVLEASGGSLPKAVKKVVGNRQLDKNVRALELGYREADHVTT